MPLKPVIFLTICLIANAGLCIAQHGRQPVTGEKVTFVGNFGQIATLEDHTPATDVLFKLSSSQGDLYITTRGLSYVFSRLLTPGRQDSASHGRQTSVPRHYEIERVDVNLERASIRSDREEIIYETGDPPSGYYLRSGYHPSRQINKVTIREIYPGIDWVIYIDRTGHDARIQQDFILHPGADARQIQFQYSGNVRVQVDASGKINTIGKLGRMTENAPTARTSDDSTAVRVGIVRHRNRLSYQLQDPIIKRRLIIDPELYWGTALTSDVAGINYNDGVFGEDVESDNNGNLYVLLSVTRGVSFPTLNPGNGAYYQDFAATPDGAMEIMKFNRGGVLLWSSFFGQNTAGATLAVDPSGDLYAAGYVQPGGTIPVLSAGGYDLASGNNNFITKFTSAGQLVWSTYWAGIQVTVTRMMCDSKGNLYLAGVEGGPFQFMDPGGGAYYKTSIGGAQGPYIAEFTPSTQLVWSTLIDGMAYLNSSERLAIDPNDNIYQCGDSVRCFNPNHQETWGDATVGWPYLADIACDRQGNLYAVGSGPGTIVKTDPGNGAFIDNTPSLGISTGFIIQYASGTHLIIWSTPFFNEAMTGIARIVADKRCDAVHLLGVMNSWPGGVPTVDNSCYNDFYFSNGQFVTTYAPIFVTFTTGGQLIYCSLTNWIYNYYASGISMTADPFGGLTCLFGNIAPYAPVPAVRDPGNGAFVQPGPNNVMYSSFLIKLIPSKMDVSLAVTTPVDCHCTGSASANILCGTAPYTYLWSTGATTPTASGLCTGNYSVTVTDANCNDTTITFTVAPPPGGVSGFNAVPDSSHCSLNDGSIQISNIQGGTQPFTFALNSQAAQANGNFPGLAPGVYQITVTDVNGCFFNDSVQVYLQPGPDSIYSSSTAASCVRSDAVLTVDSVLAGTEPFQYSLNSSIFASPTVFSNLAAGRYYLQVRDSAGCLRGDSVTVVSAAPPSGVNAQTTPAYCNNGDGTLQIGSVTGGTLPYMYSLNTGPYRATFGFDSLSPGSYVLTVLDSKNCMLEDTLQIANIPGPSAVALTINGALCNTPYGNISVGAITGGTAPFSYSLDSLNYGGTTAFDSLTPGGYTLFLLDSAGCAFKDSFRIVATYKTPFTIYPADTSICYGTNVTFAAVPGIGPRLTTFSWNAGAGTDSSLTITAHQGGYIILSATNSQNCVSVDTAILDIKDCDSLAATCVHFPNAFTPNNDGHNDFFGAIAHCPVTSFKLMIFDRYGQLVFNSTDPDRKWDGTINGTPQPSGNYVYVCQYSIGIAEETRSGSVVLVR
jgi:gliding motility-associated-like protein